MQQLTCAGCPSFVRMLVTLAVLHAAATVPLSSPNAGRQPASPGNSSGEVDATHPGAASSDPMAFRL
jgi:hypothetical protein